MASFTDSSGAVWRVVVDVVNARRVLADTGFQILRLYVPAEMERLADDPLLLADVVVSVCAEQIAERDIEVETFLRRLSGDSWEAAVLALYDGVNEFMPEKKRGALKRMIETSQAQQGKDVAALEAHLQMLDETADLLRERASRELREKVERLRSEILSIPSGGSCGTIPESAESTPDD